MYSALIIDDDPAARRRLRGQLERYFPQVTAIVEAHSCEAAREACLGGRYDLGFLNTHFGGQPAGLHFARLARHCFRHLVFLTEHDGHALEAFRARAFDYLLKPLHRPDLQRVMREIKPRKPNNERNRVMLSDRGRIAMVEEADILRVEGAGSYVTVHSLHRPPITICEHLGKFYRRLRSDRFARIHQSHLIHLDYVREVIVTDGYIAVLKDGSRVPIAKRQRKKLMQRL